TSPRRADVSGSGDATRRGGGKGASEGRVTLRGRWVRNRVADEVERPVFEDARRLARPRVPQNLTAGGGGGGLRDCGRTHCCGVRQPLMAIQPVHEYRIARRDGIDPLVMG